MALRRYFLTVLAFVPAVAGCDRNEENRPAEALGARNSPPKAASTRPADQAELAGQWFVAGVNGSPMNQQQITVGIDADTIKAQSGCVSWHWFYTRSNADFSTEFDPNAPPVCERSLSGWETAFGDALDDASTVDLISDGSLRFRGPGGMVALRRVGSPRQKNLVLSSPISCVPSPTSELPAKVTVVQGPAGPIRLTRNVSCSGDDHRLSPLVGQLTIRDGCLEIEGRPRQPLIWPAGTRVELNPPASEVHLVGGNDVLVTSGAYVQMSGVYGPPTAITAGVAQQCAGPGSFLIESFEPCPDCQTPSRPSAEPRSPPTAPPLPPPPPSPPQTRAG
jgi:hypothetical protein